MDIRRCYIIYICIYIILYIFRFYIGILKRWYFSSFGRLFFYPSLLFSFYIRIHYILYPQLHFNNIYYNIHNKAHIKTVFPIIYQQTRAPHNTAYNIIFIYDAFPHGSQSIILYALSAGRHDKRVRESRTHVHTYIYLHTMARRIYRRMRAYTHIIILCIYRGTLWKYLDRLQCKTHGICWT